MTLRNFAQLNGVPLAVTPEYAVALQDLAEFEASGVVVTESDAQSRLAAVAGPVTHASGGTTGAVGIIGISGVIGPASSWEVDASVERIGAEFDALVKDERVGTILLHIDSPGGMVYGTPELAAKIAGGRSKKRIVAYTGGMMASAAYWLGSAAHEIVAAPSAQAGSIGVYTIHVDVSRALANNGVEISLIKAGANKAEGNPFSPLSEGDRAAIQARIDDYYEQFVGAVSAHRGVTPAAVRAGYGTGRVLNARQAHAAGVIDRVATFDQLLGELTGAQAAPRRSGMRATDDALPVAALATTSQSPVPVANASVAVVPPTPAPTAARSVPVSDTATAATQAAIADTREKDLRALAQAHNKDVAWLGTAIDSGQSVSFVQNQLLSEYREQSRSTQVNTTTSVVVGETRETKKPWAGFGEFLGAVYEHDLPGNAQRDPRLGPLAAVSGMSQGSPIDGGFLVAPQFSSKIWDGLSSEPHSLLAMTDNYTVEGESITFNANAETSRATGSRAGGVRAYWLSEASAMTSSAPKFRQVRIEPQELGVFVYVTDKLLRNNNAGLEQYVTRAAIDEIGFMSGAAIMGGSGAGQPKGFLGAACAVDVAKETSQAAATINQKNISKMWARLHPRSRANAVWLHNVDIEPQLDNLSTTVTNVAGTENVGGYANKVFDPGTRTLKGRPLVACEFCPTLGTTGDLCLVDMKGYLSGTRGGVDSALSMHVRFEYREQAFRFVYEIDGQPWLASPLTPFQGTNTLTTFVTLATRA